jgi:hypothetical protein
VLHRDQPRTEGFEIHLSKVEPFDRTKFYGATITAIATTFAGALAFIGEFYEGPLLLSCVQRNELNVVEVYDWIDCWFEDPPVRARIMTPCGFRPPGDGVWPSPALCGATGFTMR